MNNVGSWTVLVSDGAACELCFGFMRLQKRMHTWHVVCAL